jgi:hypothetical protein
MAIDGICVEHVWKLRRVSSDKWHGTIEEHQCRRCHAMTFTAPGAFAAAG